ncbi:PREDICTED: plasmalemma vesicle-associated protein, partial [Corvus brachyrhynchos]|uniref:plasmalemma vesicle-associated protein n=1 Tax=Corvus brachyrhynchos TaxID=85066 RepID=UPI0008167DEA
MEKSSFAMAKFGLERKEAIPKRDCGFYVKYIFLFTSLIQFLIILGLVLFMVYGTAQAGTDTHLRLLEEQVQSHYRRIVALDATKANLSRALNATLKDKDKLQGLALKVQRELEKCNSSQASGSVPQLQEVVYLQLRLAECRMTSALMNTSCSGKRPPRKLGDPPIPLGTPSTPRGPPEPLSHPPGDIQNPLPTVWGPPTLPSHPPGDSQHRLWKPRTPFPSLWGPPAPPEDPQNPFPTLLGTSRTLFPPFGDPQLSHPTLLGTPRTPWGPSRIPEAEDELRQLQERTEGLFRWQQERDARYIHKNTCELSVQQCQLNCSREMQELERRIQGLEKRERDGVEERRKLEAEKEKVGKELEEKRRAAAAQAEALREQLGVCMGAKVGTWGQ